MNHKRKRPKHQRAGCLMCKPWKDERGGHKWGMSRNARMGDTRREVVAREKVAADA